jgi:hypothetical protein
VLASTGFGSATPIALVVSALALLVGAAMLTLTHFRRRAPRVE